MVADVVQAGIRADEHAPVVASMTRKHGMRTYAGQENAAPWWHQNVADQPVDYDVVYADVAPDGTAWVTLRPKETVAQTGPRYVPTLTISRARAQGQFGMKTRDLDCQWCGKVDVAHPHRSGSDGLVWRGGQGGDWEICDCRIALPDVVPA